MIILGDGTKTMGTNFAYLLRVAELGGAVQQLKDVTWKVVENALENLKFSSSGGFLELSDKDDTTTMIVFVESGKFHIGIIIDEEVYFYYWNGIEPVEDRVVPLAGNFFKEHQICHDFNLAKKIIKYFYETGRPLESVLWEKEVV